MSPRSVGAQEDLKRQAQLLQLSHDAIIVWRMDGGIESWNRGAEELYGFTESEAMGCVTHDLLKTFQPIPWPEIEAIMRKYGQWEGELRHSTKGGREVIVSGRLQLVHGPDGIERVLETNRDITERKQAEEALQQRTLELEHLSETLEERVRERTAELEDLSARLVSAQEDERRRVSYDLHDNAWQALVAIRLEMERLFSNREGMDWTALQDRSKKVMSALLEAVGKIRSMQGDLWPYVLDDIGLLATLDWYCREFEKNHPGLTIERQDGLSENEIPPSAKIVIYRILQETLNNVAKHSQASRVTLRLYEK